MSPQTFKAFGFEVPLPKWAASILAAIIVAAVGVFLWQKVYADPEKAVLTLKQVNEQLAADVEEYGRHAMEEPTKHELFEDGDGGMALRVYADHCVLIQRRTRDGTLTRLVPDLAKAKRRPSARIDDAGASLLPVLEAAQPCGRGCLNPHPGQFSWWYGEKLPGGWLQVWRRWPEGCQHWQAFHPQSGTWATNRDGTPNVTWSCCVH